MAHKPEFPDKNRASEVLAKIGNGCADADFARAMGVVIDRVQQTNKKGKLVLTIEVAPRDDLGVLEMRASVEAKIPKLPAPASQMHVGAGGELLSQQEWMFGGGPSEKPTPIKATGNSASARLTVASPPAPAPLADAPAPGPLATGKDAANKDA
jgi:hypothetical protein